MAHGKVSHIFWPDGHTVATEDPDECNRLTVEAFAAWKAEVADNGDGEAA